MCHRIHDVNQDVDCNSGLPGYARSSTWHTLSYAGGGKGTALPAACGVDVEKWRLTISFQLDDVM